MKMSEFPIGFDMILMGNATAMNYFAALPEQERQEVLRECETIRSSEEMRRYVECLGKRGKNDGRA